MAPRRGTESKATSSRTTPMRPPHSSPSTAAQARRTTICSRSPTSQDGRAVVFYDQIGNGRSSHYPERGADFWTVDLFVRELHNLVDALGIAGRHHVLG